MEWRWNLLIHFNYDGEKSLNPCSNGMALELCFIRLLFIIINVLILVLMEWRWNNL